jgi:hypothetical protein
MTTVRRPRRPFERGIGRFVPVIPPPPSRDSLARQYGADCAADLAWVEMTILVNRATDGPGLALSLEFARRRNNAGIGTAPPGTQGEESADRYELRFAVKYVAPFLLKNLLQPRETVLLHERSDARLAAKGSARSRRQPGASSSEPERVLAEEKRSTSWSGACEKYLLRGRFWPGLNVPGPTWSERPSYAPGRNRTYGTFPPDSAVGRLCR